MGSFGELTDHFLLNLDGRLHDVQPLGQDVDLTLLRTIQLSQFREGVDDGDQGQQ